MVSISAASASTSSLSSYASLHTSEPDKWFSIHMQDPFVVLTPPSNSSPSSSSLSPSTTLNGTIHIRLSKPTKVRSLSLNFSGFVRTSFRFDPTRIPGAKACASIDKHTFKCRVVDETQEVLAGDKSKPVHILAPGAHAFPFSFTLSGSLPPVMTSQAATISYQLTAALQIPSIVPFLSPYTVIQPVILLQGDEPLSDSLFNTTIMRLHAQQSDRLSSQVSFPCKVFPQKGTIPLMVNISLMGNATSITKVTIELYESMYSNRDAELTDQGSCGTLLEQRLVTRQNCPIQGWPSSMADEPVLISKRLLFKVPQLPLDRWGDKTRSSYQHLSSSNTLPSLQKGFCHASGHYPQAQLWIEHTLRVEVQIRGLNNDGHYVHDSTESESDVRIVGNQEYRDDDTLPPSYYRSFSTALVDGNKIREMDERAIEALQSDFYALGSIPNVQPPDYEESISSSSSLAQEPYCHGHASSSSSSSTNFWPESGCTDFGRCGLDHEISDDTFAADLAAYTERYSRSRPFELAM
ncbi:MAG: hypothetical protein BYD32DRAFT_439624 [Podila humilis]|nr:MAG: hypothetical protein BYD32DRAFT_439624 [Podila humilis]